MLRAPALKWICASLVCLGGLLLASPLHAQSLAQGQESQLERAVENHDRVMAAQADVVAAQRRAREAVGDWFPVLTPTANYGFERQRKDEADDTTMPFKEFDLSLSQLLWDFGKTNALVETARLNLRKAEATLATVRQDLILEAVTAHVNLNRSNLVLDFAKQSEGNIRHQTGLEEALVQTGSGLSTDVLQAKTQLAGAEARRIQNEGGRVSAMNRYRSVFGSVPEDIVDMERLTVPTMSVPEGLDTAMETALVNNTSLKSARLDEDIAKQSIVEARGTEFFPKIEGVIERKWKDNVAGTVGYKRETLAKVEMSVPLNLGLTGLDTIKAAKSDLMSKVRTTADTRRNVEEEVRNGWSNLHITQRTATSLLNQASIAQAFLDLARQERALGQRTLIDVLSGETSLINAQSDAVSAEADVIIAAFTLIKAIGKLDYDVLRQAIRVDGGKTRKISIKPKNVEKPEALEKKEGNARPESVEKKAAAAPPAPRKETAEARKPPVQAAKAPSPQFIGVGYNASHILINDVQVHAGPSLDSGAVYNLKTCEKVRRLQFFGAWAKVASALMTSVGIQGWVKADALRPVSFGCVKHEIAEGVTKFGAGEPQ